MSAQRVRLLVVGITTVVGLTAMAGVAGAGGKSDGKQKFTIAEAEALLAEHTREYVGTVEGTDAYISITEVDGDVDIYLCDGAGLITWPTGTVDEDGTLEAKSPSGVSVSGTLDDAGVTGTVTLADGSEHAFSAAPATDPAGLYRRRATNDANGDIVRSATIVLPDGTQRGGSSGASVAFCKATGRAMLGYASFLTPIGPGAFAGSDEDVTKYTNFRNLFTANNCASVLLTG